MEQARIELTTTVVINVWVDFIKQANAACYAEIDHVKCVSLSHNFLVFQFVWISITNKDSFRILII